MSIETIHHVCANYFNLASPEVSHPVGKILLTAMKCLSFRTRAIPFAFAVCYTLTYRAKPVQKTIGADHEKGEKTAGLHFGKTIARPFADEIQRKVETSLRVNPDPELEMYTSLSQNQPKNCYLFWEQNHPAGIGLKICYRDGGCYDKVELYYKNLTTNKWEAVEPKSSELEDRVTQYILIKFQTYFCKITHRGSPVEAFKIDAV